MLEHSLSIDFDLGTNSATDCLPTDTFDVSSLKQETPDGPMLDTAPGDAEIDARSQELSAIEDFIAKNGVTTPTAADYEPKKASWGGKAKKERRGRPRTKQTKAISFVQLNDAEFAPGQWFYRAGRGRAKLGEVRRTFEIHHTLVDTVSNGVWLLDSLVKMDQEGANY